MRQLFLWVHTLAVGVALGLPSFHSTLDVPNTIKESLRYLSIYGPVPVSETISFADLQFSEVEKNEVLALSKSSKLLFSQDLPQVPIVTRTFEVPRGYHGVVSLSGQQFEESDQDVAWKKTPPALVWNTSDVSTDTMLFRAPVLDGYFPGKFFESHEEGDRLVVNMFPVQVEVTSGRTIILRKATLAIDFVQDDTNSWSDSFLDSQSVILTSQNLLQAGRRLAEFHEKKLGLSSQVVTVEEIANQEEPISEETLPVGYKDRGLDHPQIIRFDQETRKGYDYTLARKISNFFQKRLTDTGTVRYVVVLGDAQIVPPSYYFSVPLPGGRARYGVTDQCYVATELCQRPMAVVGRLPFSTTEQVTSYLEKANRWLRRVQTENASELALLGGKAFPGDFYIGELGTLQVLEPRLADWRGIKKYYRTGKNYRKTTLVDLVSGRIDSPLAYHLDHGSGNQWFADKEALSSAEIQKLTDVRSDNANFVISIACINAAYDEKLLKAGFLSLANGARSVGVSLLQSRSTVVAYLGSARPAIGSPIFHVDKNGNLVLEGTTYGLQFFDTLLEKYRGAESSRIGDALLMAYQAYLYEHGNDMKDDRNLWTYFNVALLGDPALPLPRRKTGEKNHSVAVSESQFADEIFQRFPLFHRTSAQTLFLKFASNSLTKANLLKITALSPFESVEEWIDERSFSSDFEFSVDLRASASVGKYLAKIENSDGVALERRIRFEVVE